MLLQSLQTCLKCGGQIKVISAILSGQVIKRILTHIGENPKIPELAPSKGPPETGPHLHYEIHISGVPVNPINYILNEDISTASTGLNDTFSVY